MSPIPVYHLPCGDVRGHIDDHVIRICNIPYATSSRFQPPTAAPDWKDCLDVTGPAPACPQPPSTLTDLILGIAPALVQNEACQNLSVTLPRDATSADGLPVMVYIHGGSYVTGAGDIPFHDPKALVTEQKVIVVVINYRLGLLGGLGGDEKRAANLCVLDQVQALQWVQRNISALGGDATQVTTFGQSAGGDAVAHLMSVPGASKLFRRAIIQSAPLGLLKDRSKMIQGMLAATRTLTAETPISEVISMTGTLGKEQQRLYGTNGAMCYGTQYGHPPLPAEADISAAWDAAAPEIDVLIGTTTDETTFFITVVPTLNIISKIPFFGGKLARMAAHSAALKIYHTDNTAFANRHVRAGGKAALYSIEYRAPANAYAATHCMDLALLFGDEAAWKDAAFLKGVDWATTYAAGRKVRRIWADFARGRMPGATDDVAGVISFQQP